MLSTNKMSSDMVIELEAVDKQHLFPMMSAVHNAQYKAEMKRCR